MISSLHGVAQKCRSDASHARDISGESLGRRFPYSGTRSELTMILRCELSAGFLKEAIRLSGNAEFLSQWAPEEPRQTLR